ncbi:hypothetical protein B0H67DRAFT_578406 [Lasiosphaeris hirsuta]|uniref:Zn(2)-C6 fungal-type domain-containing protein n=1 Tax=Lasiosphaeris hirsuta TaxID=260670 RepID=A0AA40AF18_9PEZI|nr:hypothetical protein B0H67DRAFT_578406 [Lasiosphaeris hirsuta]
MFITLKSSAGQNEAGGMEQVARRNAGLVSTKQRSRANRRPACVACQTKKLRCTGSPRNCDRCRSRSIECVFPTCVKNASQNRTRAHPAHPAHPLSQPARALEPRELVPEAQGSSPHQQPSVPIPAGADFLEGEFFDFGKDLDLDIEEITRDDAHTDPIGSGPGAMVTYGQSTQPAYLAPRCSQSSGSQASSTPSTTVPTPASDTTITPPSNTNTTLPPPLCSNTDGSAARACSCLDTLVHVTSQLDDDEFDIITLSLDQQLQLQKWLVFQCCTALDCARCAGRATVHSVVLIICDRLTEMIECIHARIGRLCDVTLASSEDGGGGPRSLHPDYLPLYKPIGRGNSQLHSRTSGLPANGTSCNPLMFSDEFRNQYSDEEQTHMIRVLLRLQIRNYRQLLIRIEGTSHVITSPARSSKVRAIGTRLARASADIDGALSDALQTLLVG